ncbi:MAG: hypothetical protein HYZ49_06400 [Chloroflexi bacterium]|nr:hypothetical protein [Chloroflexota bacterium]
MSAKKTFVGGCAALGMLIVISCSWLYWRLFPPCGQPPEDPNVEVVVSDCHAPYLDSTSPDGKYMVYADDRGYWLRDLLTGKEKSLPAFSPYWLSGTLILQTAGGGVQQRQFWAYDVTDGTQTPLQWIAGKANFFRALPAIQQAAVIYYGADERDPIIVALAVDFKDYPLGSYALTPPSTRQGGDGEDEALLAFLQDNQIPYTKFRGKYYYDDPLPSHDGQLLAKGSQIVDTTGNLIVRTLDPNRDIYLISPVAGWAHDDSGVYLQHTQSTGPISILTPLLVGHKDQPILKLKVPLQYLSPEARAAEEARQAQEQREKLQRTIAWIAVVLVIVGLAVFWWRRRAKNT